MKSAIVLCSGGLDSVTTAYYVKKELQYNTIKIIFFDYGQRNFKGEERCARKCAEELKGEFIKINLDWLGKISNSILNSSKKANKISDKDLRDNSEEGEKWYVPCRNAIFIMYALALADSLFIKEGRKFDICLGFKCEGKESYPDTTKEFVEVINKLAGIGCSSDFKIIAPLIEKDKEDIVILGKELGVDFNNTFSCYVGPEKHCGSCLACKLRQKGFYWANMEDKSEYIAEQ